MHTKSNFLCCFQTYKYCIEALAFNDVTVARRCSMCGQWTTRHQSSSARQSTSRWTSTRLSRLHFSAACVVTRSCLTWLICFADGSLLLIDYVLSILCSSLCVCTVLCLLMYRTCVSAVCTITCVARSFINYVQNYYFVQKLIQYGTFCFVSICSLTLIIPKHGLIYQQQV